MIISSSKTSFVVFHIWKSGLTILQVTYILWVHLCFLLSVPPNLTDWNNSHLWGSWAGSTNCLCSWDTYWSHSVGFGFIHISGVLLGLAGNLDYVGDYARRTCMWSLWLGGFRGTKLLTSCLRAPEDVIRETGSGNCRSLRVRAWKLGCHHFSCIRLTRAIREPIQIQGCRGGMQIQLLVGGRLKNLWHL